MVTLVVPVIVWFLLALVNKGLPFSLSLSLSLSPSLSLYLSFPPPQQL